MIWRSYRKRKALRSYRTTLAAKLRGRHGTRKHYTPEEVTTAVRERHLSDVFICYAYAMYCERTAFDTHHAARGETCDFDAMRSEVGERLFDGDTTFDGATLTDTTHWHNCGGGESGVFADVSSYSDGGCSESGGDSGGGSDGGSCSDGGGSFSSD